MNKQKNASWLYNIEKNINDGRYKCCKLTYVQLLQCEKNTGKSGSKERSEDGIFKCWRTIPSKHRMYHKSYETIIERMQCSSPFLPFLFQSNFSVVILMDFYVICNRRTIFLTNWKQNKFLCRVNKMYYIIAHRHTHAHIYTYVYIY